MLSQPLSDVASFQGGMIKPVPVALQRRYADDLLSSGFHPGGLFLAWASSSPCPAEGVIFIQAQCVS